jgi:hypothetical protein
MASNFEQRVVELIEDCGFQSLKQTESAIYQQ